MKQLHWLFISLFISSSVAFLKNLRTHNFIFTYKNHIRQCTIGSWDPYSAPKLDFDECYYEVLEVDPEVNSKQLKKGYYKVVFQYHPDNKNTTEEKDLANKQMMVINGAYRVLKDPKTRSEYDDQRILGLYGAQAGVKGSGRNEGSYKKPRPAKKSATTSRNYDETKRKQEKERDEKFRQSIYDDMFSDYGSKKTYSSSKAGFQDEVRDAWQERFSKGSGFDSPYSDIFNKRRQDAANFGRNDGQTNDLKTKLYLLRKEKETKERLLMMDNKDWGEVTDAKTIEKRLQDIQEVRELTERIVNLEDELEDFYYRLNQRKRNSQPYEENKKTYNSYFDDYDDWNFKNPSQNPRTQPKTQPRREREPGWREVDQEYLDNNPNNPKNPNRSYRSWRDQQRRGRR